MRCSRSASISSCRPCCVRWVCNATTGSPTRRCRATDIRRTGFIAPRSGVRRGNAVVNPRSWRSTMTTTPLNDVSRQETGSRAEEAKEAATQGASEVAHTAKDQAASVVDATKEQGAAVVRDAKQHAQDLAQQTREQLRSQAQDQMSSLADTIQAIARQLDGLANGQPEPGMALDVTKQVASTAHRMGDRLQQDGMEGMIGEVKQFARQRPGVFLAASLVGGMVAGRVLRSTDVHALADKAKESMSSGQ